MIVMEYASKGELYDYISERRRLSERETRHFFRQIVSAVHHCHKVRKPFAILYREKKNNNVPIHDLDHLKSLSPLENIPRLCFPARSMLIVTLTMHHHRQPYSRLICRPYDLCFSWPAGFRESCVSERRWNTGRLVSKLCSDCSAPSRPGSYSTLTSHVPRYPQSLSTGCLATPTSTPDPHVSNKQRGPKVP